MAQGKDTLSEHDVRAFAKAQALPNDYVQPFYNSLMKASGMSTQDKGVSYTVFSRYVNAREGALRKVFDALDTSALPMCP
jgi:hypothetical protein